MTELLSHNLQSHDEELHLCFDVSLAPRHHRYGGRDQGRIRLENTCCIS